eukprot:365627-Pelagomonas_calceolata.AAC.5
MFVILLHSVGHTAFYAQFITSRLEDILLITVSRIARSLQPRPSPMQLTRATHATEGSSTFPYSFNAGGLLGVGLFVFVRTAIAIKSGVPLSEAWFSWNGQEGAMQWQRSIAHAIYQTYFNLHVECGAFCALVQLQHYALEP